MASTLKQRNLLKHKEPSFLFSSLSSLHFFLTIKFPPNFHSQSSVHSKLAGLAMDSNDRDSTRLFGDQTYALRGKIMLSAIVVLFFVVILMICLHLYARLYLIRSRRRQLRRRNRRLASLVFRVDPVNPNPAVPSQGLDPAVLKSLPVFVFSADSDPAECAVCLSEFEEKEQGRTLPHCNHSFHTDCIDMWFNSHSTCPLCRSPVVISSSVELVSPAVVCNSRRRGIEDQVGPSSVDGGDQLGKPSGGEVGLGVIRIEVPRREGNSPDESSVAESPAALRSPMSRMLSFTRILSKDWRGNGSSSNSNLSPRARTASEDVVVVELERGREEEEYGGRAELRVP